MVFRTPTASVHVCPPPRLRTASRRRKWGLERRARFLVDSRLGLSASSLGLDSWWARLARQSPCQLSSLARLPLRLSRPPLPPVSRLPPARCLPPATPPPPSRPLHPWVFSVRLEHYPGGTRPRLRRVRRGAGLRRRGGPARGKDSSRDEKSSREEDSSREENSRKEADSKDGGSKDGDGLVSGGGRARGGAASEALAVGVGVEGLVDLRRNGLDLGRQVLFDLVEVEAVIEPGRGQNGTM